VFCSLDLKGAYQQFIVNENTKKLLVINTLLGLYAYKRLPFGVKPAATIFQSVMDTILRGISNCAAYIDELSVKVDGILSRLKSRNESVGLVVRASVRRCFGADCPGSILLSATTFSTFNILTHTYKNTRSR
jgi:hypothetical protein